MTTSGKEARARAPLVSVETVTSDPSRPSTSSPGTARYRIRLKEPIEEQGDFIWLPYEVTDREVADSAPATDSSLAA